MSCHIGPPFVSPLCLSALWPRHIYEVEDVLFPVAAHSGSSGACMVLMLVARQSDFLPPNQPNGSHALLYRRARPDRAILLLHVSSAQRHPGCPRIPAADSELVGVVLGSSGCAHHNGSSSPRRDQRSVTKAPTMLCVRGVEVRGLLPAMPAGRDLSRSGVFDAPEVVWLKAV